MSRASDIRTYVVGKLPSCTISQILSVVTKIDDSVNHLIDLHKDRERPPFKVEFANLSFELKGNRLHTKQGTIFSASALTSFREVLEIMAGPMNLGDRTFDKLYPPFYSDVLYACGDNRTDMANLIAEIFSGLLKRYQNRSRAGANNDYQFKYKFAGDQRYVTVDIKDISFDDTDHVTFKLQASTEILSNALGGTHRVPMPTKKLGDARIAQFMGSKFVEVQLRDSMNTLISGLHRFGLQTCDIVQLFHLYQGWHKGNKLTLSVYGENEVSEPYRIVFGRAEPRFNQASVVIHHGNKSIILGSNFNVTELGVDIAGWSEMRGPQITQDVPFGTATLEAGFGFMTPQSKALATLVNDVPCHPDSFGTNYGAHIGEALHCVQVVGIKSSGLMVRIITYTLQGMSTTLGTVNQASAQEFLDVHDDYSQAVDFLNTDERKVNWEDVKPGKVGFWTKLKNWFKAA